MMYFGKGALADEQKADLSRKVTDIIANESKQSKEARGSSSTRFLRKTGCWAASPCPNLRLSLWQREHKTWLKAANISASAQLSRCCTAIVSITRLQHCLRNSPRTTITMGLWGKQTRYLVRGRPYTTKRSALWCAQAQFLPLKSHLKCRP
jgi:hypothetical protein